MKKSPLLAALLNLLFFGGGYIYNGKRVFMGVLLVVGWALISAGEVPIYLTGLMYDKWLTMFIGIGVLQISFAIDGFREAKEIGKL
jgi:hypothetical protein